jgi:carboxypeptidase Taq
LSTTPASEAALPAEVSQRMRELADLGRVQALLGWDQETYLPPKGAEARGRRMATIRGIAHERLVDPRLGDALAAAAETDLGEAEAAMVRNLARERDRAVRLPTDFVRRLAIAQSRGVTAWKRARSERRFDLFRDELSELVALKREQADLLSQDGGERYDALLEDYEPGMRVARLEPLLGAVRDDLAGLVAEIAAADQPPDAPFAGRRFAHAGQWDFTMRLLADLGYDLEAGRQDLSAHPFTTSPALHDVRITTRIDELDPFSGIFSTVHEAGHALYEQGLDPRYEDTPVGEAPSLGVHESQSRMWENVIGRSRPFWERYLPVLREHFPAELEGTSVDDVYRHVNRVTQSLIRVEADEVTYNLHILIRFDLELALMRGELEVDELPAAWNEAYERLLGIRPADDAEGVMQDIHWSQGSFGYFPTYTLGNLYAAELWERMRGDLGDTDRLIRDGEFGAILAWLRERVHMRGHLEDGEDLMRRVTGDGLRHEPFMAYLRTKYETLYGLR